jgi:hypothetical protein
MKITRSRLKQIIKEEMDTMAATALSPSRSTPPAGLAELTEKAESIYNYLKALSQQRSPDPICEGVEDAVISAYNSMVENECEVV